MAESVSHFFQPKTKRFGEVDGFAKSEPGRPTLLDPMVAPPLSMSNKLEQTTSTLNTTGGQTLNS
jgi:hypothetical protein